MEEALIRVKDLCKIYNPGENEVRALDHINLEINKGEFVAIIGQSADQRFLHLSLLSIKYPAPIQILQNRNLSFVRYQKYLLQS